MIKVTDSTQRVKIMCHGSRIDGHLKDNFFLLQLIMVCIN